MTREKQINEKLDYLVEKLDDVNNRMGEANDSMTETICTTYKDTFKDLGMKEPNSPLYAVIDHLKDPGRKPDTFATHYYKTLDEAVNAAIEKYGVQGLKDYIYDNGYEYLINDKMKEIFESIEFISKV
jgi:hypothetical protein